MKRILLGLLTLAMALAALVAVSPAPASAECPYTGCVITATNTEARRTLPAGNKLTVKVGVRSNGNSYPKGTVKMTVFRQGRSGAIASSTKTVAAAEQWVSRAKMTTPKLKKGKYKIVFRFTPKPGSIFDPSSNSRALVVR